MDRIAIVTDSTADLEPEDTRRLGITIVPAVLTVAGRTLRDGAEIRRSDFYRDLPEMRPVPTTAAPSPAVFANAFEGALSGGASRVLSLHTSTHLSSLYEIAGQAAADFGGRVSVFDSRQTSMGLGFQVLAAAGAAERRAPWDAVIEAARFARERVRLVALVDTLKYLRRSGRVGWLRAGVGELLHLRLVVEVRDGLVERIAQERARGRARHAMLSQVHSWGRLTASAALHTSAAREAEDLAGELAKVCDSPPRVVEATTIIGTHVGPNALGVAALLP